jgi:membrane protease YdiL (CAAX protease family)
MPLTFALLGLTAIAAWGAAAGSARWREWPWRIFLLASSLAALGEGFMDWRGFLVALALWGTVELYQRVDHRRWRVGCGIAALLLAAALATHRVPGFAPNVVAEALRVGPASAEMALKAHFDKAFAGLLLIAAFCVRARTLAEWRRAVGVGLLIGTATALVVIGLAVAAGALRYEPKWPAITPAWMATNLVLTCIFEEALFRGVVQHRLARFVAGRRRWAWLPLLAASLLFGLAHAGGGPVLIVVAAIAGVGYGLAFAMTGRVEAAIVAHFTLNSLHFLGFTYPYAVR